MAGLHDNFAAAFNARDMAALKALLSPEATAEVLGSGFGTERGPEDIAAKSLTHMLGIGGDHGDRAAPLHAETFTHEGTPYVLFLTVGAPPQLDTAATLATAGVAGREAITRIEYLVQWFRADALASIAAARGIAVTSPE